MYFNHKFIISIFLAFSLVNPVWKSHELYAQNRPYRKVFKLKETIEGEKLYSQGRYDEAISMFNEALNKGETRGEPDFYIGSIYESRKQYEKSIPYFQNAVKRELLPEFREATLWKLIILLQKQENYSEMIQYIDQIEDLGIKHENLKKFREEAEVNLSPEKIKARGLMKEAKKIISDWESGNRNENFWSADGNEDEKKSVLEKYTEAVNLDEALFSMYWDIADHYEKMGNQKKASLIYEKITAKNNDPKAYYKIGMILRKNGEFPSARDNYLNAVKYLDENNPIKYFLYINLSQVLYAMDDFENGIQFSKKASEIPENSDLLYDNLIYCLHLSGNLVNLENQDRSANSREKSGNGFLSSELNRKCTSLVFKKDLEQKDVRFVTLYNYMLGEVEYSLFRKNMQGNEKRKKNIVENYSRALIPPKLREVSLKGLKIKDDPEAYEETRWAVLPLWVLAKIDHLLPFFKEMRATRESYLTLLIYKKYFVNKNTILYYENLAEIAYRLELYDVSMAAYQQLHNRNFDQEKGYIRTLLHTSEPIFFQKEVAEYLHLHPKEKNQMKYFLAADPEVQKIPHDKLTIEMKNLLEIEDKPRKKFESPSENQDGENIDHDNNSR